MPDKLTEEQAGIIESSVDEAAELLADAAELHDEWLHDRDFCPSHRIELLAFVAFRFGIPPEAFADEATLELLKNELRDRYAVEEEHREPDA